MVKFVTGACAMVLTTICLAQNPIDKALIMGMGDVAAIKQMAESGDETAQIKIGDLLSSKLRSAEALLWYRKAAAQRNPDAYYHIGDMLFYGAPGIPAEQKVPASPAESVRYTFMAATNLHSYACQNMAKALQTGVGVKTNLVEAYAWWQLAADTRPMNSLAQFNMNELALKMPSNELLAAKIKVTQFRQRQWPTDFLTKVAEADHRLRLNGITFRENGSLAVINGKTLAEGESANIPFGSGPAIVKCLKIEKDAVLLAIEGETEPRRLLLSL